MKFIHISDLHIGRRLHEHSLIEDQRHILKKITDLAADIRPDAVLIAGDVYDKSVPPTEAVGVLDDFLVSLSEFRIPVLVIAGNHDSAERLSFGSRLMSHAGVYISDSYNGDVRPVTLNDSHGECRIYMLPFVRPSAVRRFFEDREISSYTDAIGAAVEKMAPDMGVRNILLCHQLVIGTERSESEDISVGGLDGIDPSVLECFDYVALGHLHRAQCATRENIRYSGSPLKYSLSEWRDSKGVTLVTLGAKGECEVEHIPLTPLRELHRLRGSYEELMSRDFYEGTSYREDYVGITLTDEDDVPDAYARLRTVYHNLLCIDYDNTRTREGGGAIELDKVRPATPFELFSDFYAMRNGAPLGDEREKYISELIDGIWGCEE